jgi:hypothetical protein
MFACFQNLFYFLEQENKINLELFLFTFFIFTPFNTIGHCHCPVPSTATTSNLMYPRLPPLLPTLSQFNTICRCVATLSTTINAAGHQPTVKICLQNKFTNFFFFVFSCQNCFQYYYRFNFVLKNKSSKLFH